MQYEVVETPRESEEAAKARSLMPPRMTPEQSALADRQRLKKLMQDKENAKKGLSWSILPHCQHPCLLYAPWPVTL